MVSLSDRFVLSPDVVYRTLGAEAIVLNLETGIYFGLDQIGNRVWELILQHDLRTACDMLATEFDAPREVIERDVVDLVSALLTKNLVVPATPEGTAR